jgi:glycosyltransferase involved in cell wall biosynthesis
MFFRKEYGFELLVEALAALRTRYPQLGCLVMGSGEDRAQAEALVRQYGLDDAIFLAGDLDHELCLALMARSAVFVRPTFRDGDSISVREAKALGVPVVASNVGTRPEGTLLFEAGNVDGLIGIIERAIEPRSGATTVATGFNPWDELLTKGQPHRGDTGDCAVPPGLRRHQESAPRVETRG